MSHVLLLLVIFMFSLIEKRADTIMENIVDIDIISKEIIINGYFWHKNKRLSNILSSNAGDLYGISYVICRRICQYKLCDEIF
jgi:hypothetical protein